MSTFPLRIGTPDGCMKEKSQDLSAGQSMVILRFCQDTAITVRHLAWEKPILYWKTAAGRMQPVSAGCFL